MAAAGFSDAGRDIPMARLIALAPTTAEAEAIARRGAQWLVDAYAGPQHAHRKTMPPRTYDGKEPAQHYVDSVILHGTPESLVDQIGRAEGDDRPQLPDVRAAQPRQLPPARRQGGAAPA